MITYVNTVFVNNDPKGVLTTDAAAPANAQTPSADAGKFIVKTIDAGNNGEKKIKIGLVTDKVSVIRKKDGNAYAAVVRWTNDIMPDRLKSYNELDYKADTEDSYKIDFTKVDASVMSDLAQGHRRIVVRLQFKDLPTRYRKWSETYEYMTKAGDTAATIAEGIANTINYQYKRQRVMADGKTTEGVLVLTAMPYDDDDKIDSLSWANKVRFTANVWYTNPQDAAFASNNKYFIKGLTITKTPGDWYAASAKLVRDREAQSFGYAGVLNQGEGTWPIIKPDLNTRLDVQYDGITLEFENTYRTADDWIKTTKQAVEIYGKTGALADLRTAIKVALGLQAAEVKP